MRGVVRVSLDSPHDCAMTAANIIKDKLAEQLVGGIRYEKDGTWYELTDFKDEIETLEEYIVPSNATGGIGGTHLYDGVLFDSEGVERPFIEDIERRKDVKLYIKLPGWFTVDTPIGRYNPDWAIVMTDPEDGQTALYLVRETKDTLDLSKLRADERRKIACGKAHFGGALGVDYRVITNASQLPSSGV